MVISVIKRWTLIKFWAQYPASTKPVAALLFNMQWKPLMVNAHNPTIDFNNYAMTIDMQDGRWLN